MPPAPADAPQVALALDAPLEHALMAHVIELCRERRASLLCLAPPPQALAVSRLEPHLASLARSGVTWAVLPCADTLEDALPTLLDERPGIELLVCDSRSALARSPVAGAVPTLILLARDALPRRPAAGAPRQPDWLAPRLHRGF